MSYTSFTDIKSVKELNDFLADKSYIQGTSVTQADVASYKAFQKEFPYFARWFNHIASFTEEFNTVPAAKKEPKLVSAAEEEDDEDVDLFGSDDEEEDAAAAKLREERLAEYAAKKASKGPKPAAKSIVTLDVKPWDDETNLEELLANVKGITQDGLTWGGHSWVPVGFGIKKLQINLVIEDTKVSLDDLQQLIEEDEDHVQSTDVAAMQKL
ncbi:translation elongation factor 1 subunit beta [Ascoidea rubescens DSM 1968]|uniref:Putative translation elongation factor 1-beta (EF-1-beta) n=1 Tax=Ascoidea rubescens DSM 1968 TaxID=1344418 RepID=A0A1D2VJC2_9ASCO|nr:putative translation elongation factor 1-beta (EF-1-beta) [Ascoidea rubescens DSM 1968]ODV61607.1 putative translation elongation factor 1-beta (EF-1-beta) [Ascoidea rubescens DSM 1968]